MNEKQPELLATFTFYKNGAVTIEYEGKTLTTQVKSSEFRTVVAMLAISVVLERSMEGVLRALDKAFEGKKEAERDE